MNISFDTPAEALAWMQKRHGIAKGLLAAEPDPKDKPVEPAEGEDEEDSKPAPETPPEAPSGTPAEAPAEAPVKASAEDPKPA